VFIEMIDLLRCPREHEETWLVAAFSEMDGRFVVEGKLGCPICKASYDIVDGVACFGGEISEAFAPNVSAESVMRTAALLNLMRPGLLVVLCGSEASAAEDLSQLAQCRVIAMNPAANIEDTDHVGTIVTTDRIPLATASVDAIAIGDCHSLLTDASRVLRPSGRLTISAETELPPGFRELARDDQQIVAEAMGPLLAIQRGI
jgi:uncharacterized protein YbaR (Trm112 family)